MDADEKGYPCYDPARIRLEDLVLNKQVILEKDVSDVDQYGRCLRYIFLSPTNFDSKISGQQTNLDSNSKLVGDEGSANIDTQLVQEGLAVARFYQPDVKYRAEITAAEQQAQQNGTGCKWAGTPQTKQ